MADTLYVIDGYSQFFRAYYARRPYQTSPVTGEPTKLVAGFADILMSLLRKEKPTWLVVALDVSGDKGTFRSDIDENYKANREAAPEDFYPQVQQCFKLLEAMQIPVVGVEGVEADDVIATMARRITESDDDTHLRIISSDKDLTQVLNDRVELFDPSKGVRTPDDVFKSQGVRPEHVIDILSLMGDSVDNIPGVPGIGPKTASKLILQYGSIEGIYEHLDEMTPKRRENLAGAIDRLTLNRKLVQLRDDLDFDFELDSARVTPSELDLARVDALSRQLGFTRFPVQVRELIKWARADLAVMVGEDPEAAGTLWADEKDEGGQTLQPADPDAVYEVITDVTGLRSFLKGISDRVCIDVETTGLDVMQADLCGISMCTTPGRAVYIPVRSPQPASHLDEPTLVAELRGTLEDASIAKIAHNAKFDLKMLRRTGLSVAGCVKDSMIASYVADASRSRHRMDDLALGLLDLQCIPLTALLGKKAAERTFDQVPLEQAGPYAAEDADITLRLWDRLEGAVRQAGLSSLLDDIELPLVRVLADMEYAGVRVSASELDSQRVSLESQLLTLRKDILDSAPGPLNPDSPRQLAAALFNDPDDETPGLGLTPIKQRKTGPSTDQEVLEKLDRDPAVATPLPGLVLAYRQLTKLVGTYLVSLKEAINPRTGRIHSSFNQVGTSTGRLSSNDPNLQNIPIRSSVGREIRRAFLPADGCLLITADYSQVELRLLAHLSGDEGLQAAFHAGEDIHRSVAAEVFGVDPEAVTTQQRGAAKMVNFGIVYGITPYGLARRLGEEVGRAAEIIKDYKARYSGIDSFLDACVEQARANGFVETICGRRRTINDINSPNRQTTALAERLAINSVVQGSAADLIKIAMIRVHRDLPLLDPKAQLILQVHDELVLEVPRSSADEARDLLVRTMESAMTLAVPLIVDSSISDNWFDAK